MIEQILVAEYRPHPAFDETIEVGIYLAADANGKGGGTFIYEVLFRELRFENVHRAVAGIALPNEASRKLHKKYGFSGSITSFVQVIRT